MTIEQRELWNKIKNSVVKNKRKIIAGLIAAEVLIDPKNKEAKRKYLSKSQMKKLEMILPRKQQTLWGKIKTKLKNTANTVWEHKGKLILGLMAAGVIATGVAYKDKLSMSGLNDIVKSKKMNDIVKSKKPAAFAAPKIVPHESIPEILPKSAPKMENIFIPDVKPSADSSYLFKSYSSKNINKIASKIAGVSKQEHKGFMDKLLEFLQSMSDTRNNNIWYYSNLAKAVASDDAVDTLLAVNGYWV